MKKESAKRSSLFLIELMTAILFFALASAVCIQVFAKSHVKSLETEELNMAVAKVQSAAEAFRNSEDPIEMLQTIFPDGQMEAKIFVEYYEENFNSCEKENASYALTVAISSESGDQTAKIVFRSQKYKKGIYSIDVKKHIPDTLNQVP